MKKIFLVGLMVLLAVSTGCSASKATAMPADKTAAQITNTSVARIQESAPASVAREVVAKTVAKAVEKKETIMVRNPGVSADGLKIYNQQATPRKGNNPFLVLNREALEIEGPPVAPMLTTKDIRTDELFRQNTSNIRVSEESSDLKGLGYSEEKNRGVYVVAVNQVLVYKVLFSKLSGPQASLASAEFWKEQDVIKSRFVFVPVKGTGYVAVNVFALVNGEVIGEANRTVIETREYRDPKVFVPGQK